MSSSPAKKIFPFSSQGSPGPSEDPSFVLPGIEAMEPVDPEKAGRLASLPPLSLLLVHSMDREKVERIKEEDKVRV